MQFDRFMIREGSLRNVRTGYQFDIRITHYRGIPLSMIEELEVTVDGSRVPEERLRFVVDGVARTMAQVRLETAVRWEFGAFASVRVVGAPLSPGGHTVSVTQQLRISYLPWPLFGHDTKTLDVIEPVSDGTRRGLTLFSLQQSYYLRERSLEECIADAAAIGATGIESLGEQMMPGFPHLPDSFYRTWRGWMDTYGTVTTSHASFLDTRVRKDRELSVDECVAAIEADIRHAAKLGARLVRGRREAPEESIARVLPLLEETGIVLAYEIHAPYHIEHPDHQRRLETFAKYGPEHLGFVLDFGVFTDRLPRVMTERWVRNGARQEVVDYIVGRYDESVAAFDGTPVALGTLPEEVERFEPNLEERIAANYATGYIKTDPSAYADAMPYVHHVHAKFWEMTDTGEEYSIDYGAVVPRLLELGYEGWFSSEYEGQRWIQDVLPVDELDQVRRQHEMLAPLLGARA
jgi:sugar phosphate isomerase/epimerase